jgi:hypothetical protein
MVYISIRDEFLSAVECGDVIRLAMDRLNASLVVSDVTAAGCIRVYHNT